MVALQNAFQVLLTRSYSPSLRNKSRTLKDTTDFVRFIENTPIPDNAIIATLDVCSPYTNIPQEEGIKVVCKYYNDHYQPNPPIPTSTLGDLMKVILKENSFHFNGKHFLQTHGIAMGTKMAVAFSVIFMAHVEKQLLLSSSHKPIIWKGSLTIFSQYGLQANKKSTVSLILPTDSIPQLNSHAKCRQNTLFS